MFMYINHDPGITLTYCTARSTEVARACEWGKLSKCHLKEKSLKETGKWTED